MEIAWHSSVRARLVGHPDRRLKLGEMLSHSELPSRPCVLPWVRLELSTAGLAGPCCADYQAAPQSRGGGPDITRLWTGPAMRAFRRAMSTEGHPETCRVSCPMLAGKTQAPSEFTFRGGSTEFVNYQLTLAQAMLNGDEDAGTHPLDLMLPPTTFCNYDCVMCEWGEMGTLDDELKADFYAGLTPFLPTMRNIEVAGGEPLASPAFRDFLATLDFSKYDQLRVSLVTNGSYLSPMQLDRLARVPFSTITLSLNAATPATYLAVNRGLAWERVRRNLDALLERRADGRLRGSLAYSMVLLRSNVHEIEAFADLARRDGVNVRFMLPMFDRNGESIMTDRDLMTTALSALKRAARVEVERGHPERGRAIVGEAEVLRERLEQGLFVPLPDGRPSPRSPIP